MFMSQSLFFHFQVLEMVNPKPRHTFPPQEFSVLAQRLGVLRTENLGNLTGTRSYYFLGGLADLEQALIRSVLG